MVALKKGVKERDLFHIRETARAGGSIKIRTRFVVAWGWGWSGKIGW